ncbi:MAG: ABC transporter ATP-binding protein/permease [Acetatifactor sp.]|nr:ABC transporter ATP-binding protein/permease [Acetatifactor sp.]MDE7354852.1 ABC transporter ATP-binding protein/permease [Acetatifactor sp.]
MNKVMRLLKTAWKSERKLCLIIIGQNLFESLIPMADIMGIGVVVDALVTGQGRKRVFTVIISYILIHAGISLTRNLFTWLKDIEARKSTNAVQYRYARQSLEVDYPYIRTGGFLTLKRKSMNIMPAFCIGRFGVCLSYILKLCGVLWIFTVIGPLLILYVTALSVPIVFMAFCRKKAEYQYRQDIAAEERKSDYLYKVMTEYAYAKDIRIYGGEKLISDKYIKNAADQVKKRDILGRNNARTQSIADLCGFLQLLGMLIVFSYMVYRKDISIAEYTVLLSSSSLFSKTIACLFESLAEIKEMCAYTDILDEYDAFIADNSKVYSSEKSGKDCGREPASIDFEHVSFRYPGRKEAALEDVSFHISSGEKVSFVGLNGAGKTTIINLLLRLYEPDTGTIKVNGMDIRELSASNYYEYIGIVLQDFYIFAYSVTENLCFDKEIDETRQKTVLAQAGLAERIAGLPRGLQTSLYKNLDAEGVELSEGEGQKLAMARALCKETGLLILDEPTSSLDPLAEYELFSRMRLISEYKTAIMVSHRLSSTRYSDRILVFDGGRLIQSGSHEELMRSEGMYRELYSTQAKYYTGEGGLYEA